MKTNITTTKVRFLNSDLQDLLSSDLSYFYITFLETMILIEERSLELTNFGTPIKTFQIPTSSGIVIEFENSNLIDILRNRIDSGKIEISKIFNIMTKSQKEAFEKHTNSSYFMVLVDFQQTQIANDGSSSRITKKQMDLNSFLSKESRKELLKLIKNEG